MDIFPAFEGYDELLKDERWLEFRERMFEKIGRKCENCGSRHNLEIHHRFYVFGRKPWEYGSVDVQVLCHSCHAEIHMYQYLRNGSWIKVYDENGFDYTRIDDRCPKCNGTGRIPAFWQYDNGKCYSCNGTGKATYRGFSKEVAKRFAKRLCREEEERRERERQEYLNSLKTI